MTREYIKVLIESPTEKIAEKVEVFVLGPIPAPREEPAGFARRVYPDGVMWECFLPMFRLCDRGGTREEALRNVSQTLVEYLHSEMKSGLSYDQTRRPFKRWEMLVTRALFGLRSLATKKEEV